ncbi:MAG: Na+/H+-dicarboxylate symporter [Burkholderiaceae bacterium]|jgi:Na+/H+-dicarboxylate symporter
MVNVLQSGAGMHIDPTTFDIKGIANYVGTGKLQSASDFLLNIIPPGVVDAFAKGEILQVLMFSILFGFALHRVGGRGTLVFDFIGKISHVPFGIVGGIVKFAPIGAFGAMAFTIGKYGVGSLLLLGKLIVDWFADVGLRVVNEINALSQVVIDLTIIEEAKEAIYGVDADNLIYLVWHKIRTTNQLEKYRFTHCMVITDSETYW